MTVAKLHSLALQGYVTKYVTNNRGNRLSSLGVPDSPKADLGGVEVEKATYTERLTDMNYLRPKGLTRSSVIAACMISTSCSNGFRGAAGFARPASMACKY